MNPTQPATAHGALVGTLRILRVAILGAVATMLLSLLFEIWRDGGTVEGSISAYFYSPVRSVFVGGLMAIGLGLLAIRGHSPREEVFLNLAAMFAPIVALVPKRPPECHWTATTSQSVNLKAGDEIPADVIEEISRASREGCLWFSKGDPLPDWLVTGVRNNVGALLLVGLAAALIVRLRVDTSGGDPGRESLLWKSTIIYITLIVAGVLFVTWGEQKVYAHYAAAILMFAFLALVAWDNWRSSHDAFRTPYKVCFWSMVALALAVGAYKLSADVLDIFPHFKQDVFTLEVGEIVAFGAFWVVQTIDRWHEAQPIPLA